MSRKAQLPTKVEVSEDAAVDALAARLERVAIRYERPVIENDMESVSTPEDLSDLLPRLCRQLLRPLPRRSVRLKWWHPRRPVPPKQTKGRQLRQQQQQRHESLLSSAVVDCAAGPAAAAAAVVATVAAAAAGSSSSSGRPAKAILTADRRRRSALATGSV
eukprot:TRINITY_DN226_c0_g1_i13.p1 TRINITY_DN226_c0_g1~~TRINITY_DN226_c0_g1_i13.p1  ORF type:complete len:161 (+),score=42.62 TRINITY_DN226_c0_g1_i13:267-749(+)